MVMRGQNLNSDPILLNADRRKINQGMVMID